MQEAVFCIVYGKGQNPVNTCLLKVSNRNSRRWIEIFPKIDNKNTMTEVCNKAIFSKVNNKDRLTPVTLFLLTLNIFHTLF